jgi:SAM-dependent methyltransferase
MSKHGSSFIDRARPIARQLPPVLPELALRALRAASVAPGLVRYARDRRAYRRLPEAEPLRLRDSHPKVADRLPTSPFDPHYFYQDVWAARWVAEARPRRHVDVGSRVDYVGFLTTHTAVTFVDIRPLEAELEGLTAVTGSILGLPFEDRSLESLSCLHVAEHIGLGRYGDPLDPLGTRRAARELQRVLAPGGQLLFSLPVGERRTCFNAHRIHAPVEVVELFDELVLSEVAGVDDHGSFARGRELGELAGSRYACGMFRFVRPGP